MRRRRTVEQERAPTAGVPDGLPVELARFVPAEWPPDGPNDLGEPYGRWTRARHVWADEHDVDPRKLPGRLSARERLTVREGGR